jgi:hypothetical protein
MKVDLNEKPTTPPPDPNKPHVWLAGKWYLVATDSSDEVPDSLDDLPGTGESEPED